MEELGDTGYHEELVKGDRVRANTPREINEKINRDIRQSLFSYAGKSDFEIGERIDELDKEWDIDRMLETNASVLAFTGVAFGFTINRKWFLLSGVVTAFLFQHAVQGWCPPVSLFRRFGVRTRKEIDVEKYALKALRGDFGAVAEEDSSMDRAIEALCASKNI
ncbi:DUF2892 domain-containing protein [Methanolobus halotolerans]|uniref:DUF2892 domain-containing protein n=1 Tax=Methanolobus halotolerans TaxID=2052935 RepID=A0A4E0PYZ3_9EURY|nr:DUF2892 domain-containing protein [Methanolobus halotolerans]TGC11528.1 hypothetical protein CUN85_01275 [Methanolobus halotolerans]